MQQLYAEAFTAHNEMWTSTTNVDYKGSRVFFKNCKIYQNILVTGPSYKSKTMQKLYVVAFHITLIILGLKYY